MVTEEQSSDLELASERIPVPQIQEPPPAVNPKEKPFKGKPRLRKKALNAGILKQLEFYFSDANLSKDRFLSNLIQQDPYVDLTVFLRFNKIFDLTRDVHRIERALQGSTTLSLSEDGTKVCRSTPFKRKENEDECTVYVQNLPPDADHEWLNSLFDCYGSVAYVSIPKYKHNKKIKGFGFIEFDTPESAEKCLQDFKEKGCVLPSHTSPDDILSITTFDDAEKDVKFQGKNQIAPPTNTVEIIKKRKFPDEDEEVNNEQDEPATSNCKKRKLEDEGTDQEKEKHVPEIPKDEEKKKKRKRKKKSKMEYNVCNLGLEIISKKDWKRLRNKYLELQRNKMKQLKQHLNKKNIWNKWSNSEKIKCEEENEEKDNTSASVRGFSFTPGVIVKIELNNPCTNPKDFKMEFRGKTGVKYIDIDESSFQGYIRCDTTENAKLVLQKSNDEKRMTILEGDEEQVYWDKMLKDRQDKFNKKIKVKQRGRDKLLKKAEKVLGKHIKFDD